MDPYNSYKEFVEMCAKKGSGINVRAVQALNAIGALTFEDNKRNADVVKENLYEYLNLPIFTSDIPSHFYAYINDIEDFDEQNAFVLMGVVKNIKRGKGWSRVEIMDRTGLVGVFDDEETKIEQGKTYIFLVGANRINDFVSIDEVRNFDTNSLVKFLNYKILPYGLEEYYVLSFKPRVTKAGKKMASMIVANANREMKPVIVFPRQFSEGYMKCEPGTAVKLKFDKSDDGSLILSEVIR
jgi:hypothetical protein